MADFPAHNLGNVIRCAREKSLNHPTEKPATLLRTLVGASTKEGQTVIDPFMDSGTTGVACAMQGRKFIGMEMDRRHFDTAYERIEAAYGQPDLFVQQPLLPAA